MINAALAKKTAFEKLEIGEQRQFIMIEEWLKEAMEVPVNEFPVKFTDRIPLVNKYIKPANSKGKSIPTEIIEFHGAYSCNLVDALFEGLNNIKTKDQNEWQLIPPLFLEGSKITMSIGFEKPLIKVIA